MTLKTHSRYKGIKYFDMIIHNESKPLIILLHPFFEKSPNPLYVKSVADIVNDYTGPILTLDDEVSFRSSYQFIKRCMTLKYNSATRFFTLTQPSSNERKIISNEKFFDFLKEYTTDNFIKLAGGYYNDKNKNGCLDCLELELNNNGFSTEPIKHCTFSRNTIQHN